MCNRHPQTTNVYIIACIHSAIKHNRVNVVWNHSSNLRLPYLVKLHVNQITFPVFCNYSVQCSLPYVLEAAYFTCCVAWIWNRMYLKKIGVNMRNCFDLAKDSDSWRAFVNVNIIKSITFKRTRLSIITFLFNSNWRPIFSMLSVLSYYRNLMLFLVFKAGNTGNW